MDHFPQALWLGLLLVVCILQIADSTCPLPCKCSTYGHQQLIVTCEHKKLTSVPSNIPKQTVELYLGHNFLANLPDNAFSGLTQLRQLSLKNNVLSALDDGAFKGLSHLTSLFLTKNKLRVINQNVFSPLISLTYIYLTQNNLQVIPDLGKCVKLKKLNLDNNWLANATFPAGYSNLKGLKSIDLTNNPLITKINRTDFIPLAKSNLVKLSVQRCGLTSIENGTFHLLQSLLSLKLAYNKIPAKNLKNMIDGLQGSKINSLDLSGVITGGMLASDTFEALEGVPLFHLTLQHSLIPTIHRYTFQYLSELQTLDISASKIFVAEPGAFEGLKKLQRLLLHHNRFDQLPQKLPKSCVYIDLSYNGQSVTEIQVGVVDDLPKLQELYINHCQVDKIANGAFQSTVNLRKLDLSYNELPNNNIGAEVFQSLSKLEVLDLSHNKLVNFQKEHSIFKYLKNLKMLNMSYNGCEKLSLDIFSELNVLESLDLSHNNLGMEIAESHDQILFGELQKLISLNISNNNIYMLLNTSFSKLPELKYLQLENNDISELKANLFAGTTSLHSLNLASNHISVVNQSSLNFVDSTLESINLSNNPFSCYCSLVWFRNWINTTNITLENLQTYTCSSPKNMVGKTVLSFRPSDITSECKPPPWMIITITVGVCVFVVMCITGITLYRNRWKIRLWAYLHTQTRRDAAQGDQPVLIDDFKYDCFVSVCEGNDEDWVRDDLLPKMDNGNAMPGGFDYGPDRHGQYSLCCAAIHLLPGNGAAYYQIADAIEASRKFLILLTKEYILSGQQMHFELPLALRKASEQGWDSIILVILEEGADVRVPHGKLHELLDNEEELKWTSDPAGQEVFWIRLADSLNVNENNYQS